jgi:hypothetical protein
MGGHTDSQLRDTCVLEPGLDVPRIEADELAELDERDAALGHQPTNEALGHAQPVGQARHVEEWRRRGRVRLPQRGHAQSVALVEG